MKKSTKVWLIVLICVVASVIVAVPVVRAYCYWSDEPVFIGNPTMQQLIYHGSDIVMLPEKRENIHATLAYATYNGNTYVGEYGIDWIFDEDKMQYAGQMHRRMILHLYNNYDVYVSANAVTEDGTPIFLTRKGEPSPFYYVLEGYEAPNLMTTDLKLVVETKGNEWNLPNTVKLADIVDLQNEISYNDAMKKICTARLVSAQYDFMCTFAPVYKLGEQYYLHIAMNTYCPITSEDLIEYLSRIEKQQTV